MHLNCLTWLLISAVVLLAALQLSGCQATSGIEPKEPAMSQPTTQPTQHVRVAILRKPDLKVMGLAHDGLPPDEFFQKFPPQTWGTMNAVPGLVSGTRGYMFRDRDLAKDADEFHTICVEVPTHFDKPLPNTFLRLVPSSVYAVFYREPGSSADVFAASKKWRDDNWKSNPNTVQSYDDHEGEGFFVFVPIIATSGDPAVPEIPVDPKACYKFIKSHSRPLE
jgi:hypothetical protein